MEKQAVIEEMYRQNPWWATGEVKTSEGMAPRDLFGSLSEELGQGHATAVTGLRRVGKTTLLRLLIGELLDKGTTGNRIFYFSFDLADQLTPLEVLGLYETEILKEPFDGLTSRVFIFFDEIQKVHDWGNQVKSVQDKGYDIKFTLSGSSAANITKGAGESLVGRIMIRRLHPFSFGEFLRLKGIPAEPMPFDELRLPPKSVELRIAFNEYMEMGGLPELYGGVSLEMQKQNLDLTFFRDVVGLFPVKRVDILEGLFRSIAENSGQKMNFTQTANDLNTQYRTITDYLQYMTDSFLVSKSQPWAPGTRTRLRKNPKMYVSDHSHFRLFRCPVGLRAQTIAYNHLVPEKQVALEVKYTRKPERGHVKNLLSTPSDTLLFLVTENTYDTWTIGDREIRILPLWLFCLATW